MANKIKFVPRGTTKSVATLVYPSGISRSLPDERPSNWYNYTNIINNLNVSVLTKMELI